MQENAVGATFMICRRIKRSDTERGSGGESVRGSKRNTFSNSNRQTIWSLVRAHDATYIQSTDCNGSKRTITVIRSLMAACLEHLFGFHLHIHTQQLLFEKILINISDGGKVISGCFFSKRVATRRNCLSFEKQHSTRWR